MAKGSKKPNDTELKFGLKFDNKELARGIRESLRILSSFTRGVAREFSKLNMLTPKDFKFAQAQKLTTPTLLPSDISKENAMIEQSKRNISALQKDIDEAKKQGNTHIVSVLDGLIKEEEKNIKRIESIIDVRGKIKGATYKEQQPIISKSLKTTSKGTAGENKEVSFWKYGEAISSKDLEPVDLLAKREKIIKRIYDSTTDTTKELVRTITSQQKLTQNGLQWEKVSDVTKENVIETSNRISSLARNMSNTTDQVEIFKKELEYVNKQLEQNGLSEGKVYSLGKKRLELIKKISDLENPAKTKKKGIFRTFFDRLKSVSIYRSIRGLLKELVNSFNESISGIASVSSEFKNSLSGITSQLAKLRALSAVVLYQVLMNYEGEITSITNGLVDMANKFALSMAIMRGSGKVIQINKDYWEEYKDAMNGALLSFDTFNTLSSQSTVDFQKLFNEVKLDEFTKEQKKDVSGYVSILDGIKNVLKDIYDVGKTLFVDIIQPIWNTGITRGILEIVGGTIKLLSQLGLLKIALIAITTLVSISKITKFFSTIKAGVATVISGVKSVIQYLGSLSKQLLSTSKTASTDFAVGINKAKGAITGTQLALASMMAVVTYLLVDKMFASMGDEAKKIVAPIMAAVSAITAITVAVLAYKGVISGGLALPILLTSVATAIASGKAMLSKNNLTGYASGGQFSSGDFFVANENGKTELIASNNSGGGNVMNLDQWRSVSTMGFYDALVMYNAAKNENGDVDLDRLSTLIARNKAFKSELNRTNPKLSLL